MNNIYLATKLYSFFDRKVSTIIYNVILKSKKFENCNIYLPFKDSNMKVSYQENAAKNIFDADIKSLIDTNIFITRHDGPSYDSGVGFEIGYCLGNEIPIYIFNSDFYENKLSSQFKYKMTPILDKFSNVYTYQYKNNERLNYDEELDYNTNEFSNSVTEKLNDSSERIYKIVENEEKYDILIDFLGSKYEW